MALFEDKNKPTRGLPSTDNPIAKAIIDYGNSVPAGEKQARIDARNQRNLASFAKQPVMPQGPSAMAVSSQSAQPLIKGQSVPTERPENDLIRERVVAQRSLNNISANPAPIGPPNDAQRERNRADTITNNLVANNRTLPSDRANMTGERVVGGNMPGYVPQFGPAAQPGVREAIVKTPQVPMQTVYQNQGNRVYSTQQPVRERILQPQPNLTTGGKYSFQGTQDAAQKFVGAVSPREYSQAAQAARNQQQRQFLGRNGYEEVDPNTGLTASDMLRMKPIQRAGVMDAVAGRKNERAKIDIDRTLATGNLELGRGKLGVDREQLGISKKQAEVQGKIADSTIAANELDMSGKRFAQEQAQQGAAARLELANTTDIEQRRIRQQRLKDMGIVQDQPEEYDFKTVKQPMNQDMTGGGETLYKVGKRSGVAEPVDGGVQQPQAPQAAIERLKKFKDYDNFKAKYGYIPEGI